MALTAVSAILAASVLAAQPDRATGSKQPSNNQSQTPVVLSTPERQNSSAYDRPKADPDTPPWYTTFKQPDGMLVIVGIVTCFVIGWQSCETRRAAKATQKSAEATLRSVELHEAELRQWVETTDEWEVRTDYYLPNATETILRISFGIVNPTKWPLTLTHVRGRAHEDVRDYPLEQTLGPQELHALDFSVPLQGQIFGWFKKSYFDAEISLDVRFIDNLRQRRVQAMDFICRCFPSRKPELRFRPRAQRDEAYAIQQQLQNPN